MKTKRGLCIALSAVMIATSLTACSKKVKIQNDSMTVTNENGEICVVITDKNGDVVKDKDGNDKTVVLTGATVDSSSNKTDSNDKNKSTTKNSGTKKANTPGTTGANRLPDFNQEVDVTAKKEDLLPTGKPVTTKKNAETLRDSVVAKTIKTGKFTMKANIISGGNKMPATISFKDKDFCMEVTYSQFQMRVLSMNSKMYLVMPALKMYYETTDESTTDIFDFGEITNEKQTYVKTTKVNNLTCEEYKSDEGTSRYYFDSNNQWKRFESIDADGTMAVFEISSFTNKAESSLFSLSGFNKMDEKALEALGGGLK